MRYLRLPTGHIKALKTFTLSNGLTITRGTLGGTIDSLRNLSQSGTCWVFPGGAIKEDGYVSGAAVVCPGNGIKGIVRGATRLYGNAAVVGGTVRGQAKVLGDAVIQNGAIADGNACVFGSAKLMGRTCRVTLPCLKKMQKGRRIGGRMEQFCLTIL